MADFLEDHHAVCIVYLRTVSDTECDRQHQQLVKETIGVGVNEKAVLRFYQTALSFTSISIFPW